LVGTFEREKQMSRERCLRAGLCGIGLDAYWSQFASLEGQLKRPLGVYHGKVGANATEKKGKNGWT
jgi:hypothetical protein